MSSTDGFVQITVDPKYLNLALAYKIEPWQGHLPGNGNGARAKGIAIHYLSGAQNQIELVVGWSVEQLMRQLGYSPPEQDAEELKR